MIVIHFKLIFNYYILKNFGKNKHLKNFRKKIFSMSLIKFCDKKKHEIKLLKFHESATKLIKFK